MEVKRMRRAEASDGVLVMQELENGEWMIVVTAKLFDATDAKETIAAITISRAEARAFASFISRPARRRTRR